MGLLTVLVLAICPVRATCAQEPTEAETHLNDAFVWYKLALARQGDMRAFDAAAASLDEAEADLSAADAGQLRQQIDALRDDVEVQADMAHDTLRGVFPLVTMLGGTLFRDDRATGTYELVDDPDVVAASTALERLELTWREKIRFGPAQTLVVVRGERGEQGLANEGRYLLAQQPFYRVLSHGEIAAHLSADELARLWNADTPAVLAPVLAELAGGEDVLLVTVREAHVIADAGVYFLTAEGRLFDGDGAIEDPTLHPGLCEDRRPMLAPLGVAHLLLWLIAVAAFGVYRSKLGHEDGPGEWLALAGVAALPFAFGRVAPWVLMEFVAALGPAPEVMAKLAWWWPATVGAVLFLGPPLLYFVGTTRVPALLRSPGSIHNTLPRRALFIAVNLGTSAYLAVPLFLMMEGKAWGYLVAGCAILILTAWLMGLVVDGICRAPVIAVASLLAVVGGLALGTASAPPIGGVVAAGVVLGALALRLLRVEAEGGADEAEEDDPKPASAEPAVGDTVALVRAAEAPAYVRDFPAFDEARRALEPLASGDTVWLGIAGARGRGKTSMARALLADLGPAAPGEFDLVVLEGTCPLPSHGQTSGQPYAPFQQALARHFKIDLLQPPNEQLAEALGALDDVFDNLLPFSGLLFPPGEGAANGLASQDEMFHVVEQMLRKRASRSDTRVVLFIDDVHWIDEGSSALLDHLAEALPPGTDLPLAVIVTARTRPATAAFVPAVTWVDMDAASGVDNGLAQRILTDSLGIEDGVARRIVDDVYAAGDEGGFVWLLAAVRHLATHDAFVRVGESLELVEALRPEDTSLPLPTELGEAVAARLDALAQHRIVLECAACLGREFQATVLAGALERPRMDVLRQLRRIERESGILVDVLDRDDCYRFRSPFLLEVVRENMRIDSRGPASDVPQVVREHHARVAAALQDTLEDSPAAVYEVFEHLYAAGANRALDAVRAGVRAVRAARRAFTFAEARRYLEMARECADAAGGRGSARLEEEELLIVLDRAHVRGEGHAQAAEAALAYLDAHSDAPLAVLNAAARACYEAGSPGNPAPFRDAAALGERILAGAQTDLERAEGHHFVGISLDRRSQCDALRQHLDDARALVAGAPSTELAARALLARIDNSYAEIVMWGSPDDRQLARELFEESIVIKSTAETQDRPGLARSYGGMGRLALFASPPDLERARHYLQLDLDLSEELRDISGQAQMQSLLGACDLESASLHEAAGRAQEATVSRRDALTRYASSWEFAQRAPEAPMNLWFAGTGALTCCAALEREDGVDEFGDVLLGLASAEKEGRPMGVPYPVKEDLRAALEAGRTRWNGAWMRGLLDLVTEADHG